MCRPPSSEGHLSRGSARAPVVASPRATVRGLWAAGSGAARGGGHAAGNGEHQMKRRHIIAGLLALLVAPRATEAQQAGKVHRIGFLGNSTAALEANLVDPFREGLRDLGYVEGQTVVIMYRWAEGKYERLPALVADLIGLKVDMHRRRWNARGRGGQEGDVIDSSGHGRCRRPYRHGSRHQPRSAWRKPHRVGVDCTGPGGQATGAAQGSAPKAVARLLPGGIPLTPSTWYRNGRRARQPRYCTSPFNSSTSEPIRSSIAHSPQS